jgi:hypothetical protein
LPPGETVVLSDQPVLPGSHRFNLFACGDLAEDLLGVKKGATLNARAKAAFGALAPIHGPRTVHGLQIVKILDVTTSTS